MTNEMAQPDQTSAEVTIAETLLAAIDRSEAKDRRIEELEGTVASLRTRINELMQGEQVLRRQLAALTPEQAQDRPSPSHDHGYGHGV